MPDPQAIGQILQQSGGINRSNPRDLYQQWQQALAELETMRSGGPPEVIAPEYRVTNGGTREYNIGGKWASERAYQDPQFQATVVDPWIEQEKMRRAEEYNKSIADAQQRAAMYEYDYNDFQRRQDELKQNGVGKSTFGRPSAGGMGSTTRR